MNALFSRGIYLNSLEEIKAFYKDFIVDLAAVALPGVEILFGRPQEYQPQTEFESRVVAISK